MAYHTTPYLLLFLPAALLFYQITPAKWRSYTLLIFSYLFFWSFSEKLIIYLIGTTFLTHHICIWMDTMDKRDKRKKRVLQLGIFLLLGTILCLKYRNFFFGNVSKLAMALHIDWSYQDQLIFLPIGISLYTVHNNVTAGSGSRSAWTEPCQYMADVYWGKVKAEYSLVKTALFLGFFPVIVEGPICRWEDVEDTLFKNESVKAENVFKGCYRIIWGLFKKMIIADRLAVLVDKVYVGYESYSGAVIVAAAISYTIQLYMEFSGCMEFACRRISASRFLQRHVQISGNDGTLRLVSGSRTISFIQYPFPRRPESGISLRENISKGILENMWREWELQQWHFSRYGSAMVCGTVRNGITFFTDYITLD